MFFFFQAEDGIRDLYVTGVQTCALPISWRTSQLPDREVIDALVHPVHAGPSPALKDALAQWPGSYYWSDEPDGRHLVLTRKIGRASCRERVWISVGAAS